MLKLLGCICILAASGGMAYSCVAGLRQKLRQTELLLELLPAAGTACASGAAHTAALWEAAAGNGRAYGRPYRGGYSVFVERGLRYVPPAAGSTVRSLSGAAAGRRSFFLYVPGCVPAAFGTWEEKADGCSGKPLCRVCGKKEIVLLSVLYGGPFFDDLIIVKGRSCLQNVFCILSGSDRDGNGWEAVLRKERRNEYKFDF